MNAANARTSKFSPYLALAALGVVYGDIGTSPLYAMRACFATESGLPPSFENVTGILSLIFWAITWVVVIKYLSVLMRASNHGEGGIMALIALLIPRRKAAEGRTREQIRIIFLGLFGAALLYGDGIITPAVSVLSAVEGLGVETPLFTPYIVPITVCILIGLFLVQRYGTDRVGGIFGPVMLVWFITLGAMAVPWLLREPRVFWGLNPFVGISFLLHHGMIGALVLTGVVLCITGAEALYADMGHFGAAPIRHAWYAIVYPALVLNYFGQGALLIEQPQVLETNPFFSMLPHGFLFPMVILATFATVIASQALISGAFSMTQQAIVLGFLPRLRVYHTSRTSEGQIYIPKINQLLLVCCVALVLAFQTSDSLTGAYGIAVTGTMLITSLLFYQVSQRRWRWPLWASLGLSGLFVMADTIMLLPNLTKILHGGWVPVVVAIAVFILMTTWSRGQRYLVDQKHARSLPTDEFLAQLEREKPLRVPGTALFITREFNRVPADLLNNYRHNHVVHESVILLVLSIEHVPTLPFVEHGRTRELAHGFHEVRASFGFMQQPNLTDILNACALQGMKLKPDEISFFLARDILGTHGESKMAQWRKRLFSFTAGNAQPIMEFLGVNAEWVIETGALIEL